MRFTIFTGFFFLVCVNSAQALDLNAFFQLTYDVNPGEDILVLTKTDGSTDKVTASEGMTFGLGGSAFEGMFGAKINLGYKSIAAKASNGEAGFRRFPIDVMAMVQLQNKHRIGAGVSYHYAPKFYCDISGICDGSVKYDNSLGYVLEYTYVYREPKKPGEKGLGFNVEFGGRFLMIDYGVKDLGSFSGNSFGIFVGFSGG